MADTPDVIVLNDIHKSFESGPPVLRGLSISVPRGAVFGLLGLNGAGKTTTMRILAGLLAPDRGDVRILGIPARERTQPLQGRIGYVLDEPLYFEWLSAREYLLWIGQMQGLSADESTRRLEELLDRLELPGDDARVIGEYSTGMKKKVSVAAALIHAPELFILDEPLEGVDAASSRTIRTLLSGLAVRGKTVFITSHMLDTLERFCTHVGVLHGGAMLLQCPIEQLSAETARILHGEYPGGLEDLFLRLVRGPEEARPLRYE